VSFTKGDKVRFVKEADARNRDTEDKCKALPGDTGLVFWLGRDKKGREKYGVGLDAKKDYAAFVFGSFIELQGGSGGGGGTSAPPDARPGKPSGVSSFSSPTSRIHVTKFEVCEQGIVVALRIVTPVKDVEAVGFSNWEVPDPASLAYHRAKGILMGTSKPKDPEPSREPDAFDEMGDLPF